MCCRLMEKAGRPLPRSWHASQYLEQPQRPRQCPTGVLRQPWQMASPRRAPKPAASTSWSTTCPGTSRRLAGVPHLASLVHSQVRSPVLLLSLMKMVDFRCRTGKVYCAQYCRGPAGASISMPHAALRCLRSTAAADMLVNTCRPPHTKAMPWYDCEQEP